MFIFGSMLFIDSVMRAICGRFATSLETITQTADQSIAKICPRHAHLIQSN